MVTVHGHMKGVLSHFMEGDGLTVYRRFCTCINPGAVGRRNADLTAVYQVSAHIHITMADGDCSVVGALTIYTSVAGHGGRQTVLSHGHNLKGVGSFAAVVSYAGDSKTATSPGIFVILAHILIGLSPTDRIIFVLLQQQRTICHTGSGVIFPLV